MNDTPEKRGPGKPGSFFPELGKTEENKKRYPAPIWALLALQWIKNLLGLIALEPTFAAKIQALVEKQMAKRLAKEAKKTKKPKATD